MLIRVSRLRGGFTIAVGCVLALSGCATAPAPLPGTTASVAPTPTATVAATPGVAPTPDSSATIPLEIDCAELISAQAMFDFNPNFAALDGWTPEPGTPGATALTDGGVACRWVSESGGASIELAASRLGATALAAAIDAAAGTPAPFGDHAVFSTDANGRGVLVVFSGSARLVLSSEYFGQPADATALVTPALDALS